MINFVLFGAFGWCAEIVWTAATSTLGALWGRRPIDRRLMGHTYLWMFPIYGAGGWAFGASHSAMASWPWPLRGAMYMLGCFAVEYASGWVIKRLSGKIPWDYSRRRWQVHGLIRLDYAPVWFVFGMLLEWIEHFTRVAEPVLRAAGL